MIKNTTTRKKKLNPAGSVNLIRIFFSIALFIFLSIQAGIGADTLTLKDGKVFENVKIFTKDSTLEIHSEDGTRKMIQKSFVKSIKLKTVIWKISGPPPKDAYEVERLRLAEIMLESSSWQPKEDEKPRLMILNFKMGRGIDAGKAEELSGLIRNRIIKTNVFLATDRLSVEKEIEKSNCKTLNCSKEIASRLQVNKLLSGEVSIYNNKYHIVGEVIDIKTNRVEFTEVFEFSKDEDAEGNLEIFTARIIAGTLDSWDYPVYNPESLDIKPYIWRSLLVPGWGQYEKETYSRAWVYPVLIITGGVLYQNQYNSYQTNRKEYLTNTNLFLLNQNSPLNPYLFLLSEEKKGQANSSANRVNLIANALISVYIINLLDVIFTPVPMELKALSFQWEKESPTGTQVSGNQYYFSYTFTY